MASDFDTDPSKFQTPTCIIKLEICNFTPDPNIFRPRKIIA